MVSVRMQLCATMCGVQLFSANAVVCSYLCVAMCYYLFNIFPLQFLKHALQLRHDAYSSSLQPVLRHHNTC